MWRYVISNNILVGQWFGIVYKTFNFVRPMRNFLSGSRTGSKVSGTSDDLPLFGLAIVLCLILLQVNQYFVFTHLQKGQI